MALTVDQSNAASVRDRTLLVSAAAGSGKTYTLTQRIIKAIIEDGQDISRLLIVTFTKAAAGELKAKISKAIGEAISEHPDNIHLQDQLIKIGSAHISTIDSFFTEPVRSNFEKLGLPASLRLADEAELEPLRESIMQSTLDRFFDDCGEFQNEMLSPVGYSDSYTDLLGIITGARDSSDLCDTLCDIYKKLLTSPDGLEQLEKHAQRLKASIGKDFFETKEGLLLKNELLSTVRYAYSTFKALYDELVIHDETDGKYLACFEANVSLCLPLLNILESNCKYEDVQEKFQTFDPKKIPGLSEDKKTDRTEFLKDARSELNTAIKNMRKDFLSQSAKEIDYYFNTYYEMSILLYRILFTFHEKYSAEKISHGICEFSDMPRFVLKLLKDKDGNPTEYSRVLSSSFDEVYIDEYQDVNEIQDTIFELIGRAHRFMVGDIKQSIYGFREAEPSIFAEYRRKFPIYSKDNQIPDADGGNTIFMSENFRCDENVINFTNKVCSDIFSAYAESIGYTKDDDLKFAKGKPYEEYQSPAVTINIVQTPEGELTDEAKESESDNTKDTPNSSKGLGDEAIITANEIANLIRNGKNADGTAIRPKHIAILVRSHSHAKPLIKALQSLNVKYALSSKGELFEKEEMRLLVDILSIVDNPRLDMPLSHVLVANTEDFDPFFTLEEVITIRRDAESSKSLYDAIISYSQKQNDDLSERCRDFIELINDLRAAANRLSAEKLIKALSAFTRISSITHTDAYTYLYDSACNYVKNTWSGLYNFLKYFKNLMEKGESGAEPSSKKTDAVTIMTIHQSKGLEFNVCFLFGFGKQFNTKNKYPIVFSRDFGAMMKLPPMRDDNGDLIDRIKVRCEDNPINKIIGRYIKRKQLEEEARIFYVALTRARERLIISATLREAYETYAKKIRSVVDKTYYIRNGQSFINWILLSLLTSEEENDWIDIRLFDKGAPSLTFPFANIDLAEFGTNISEKEKEFASLMSMKETKNETERILSTVPSKVAASKISPNMLDENAFVPIPTGKLFSENGEDGASGGGDNARIIRNRIELMRSSRPTFDSLLDINKRPSAAEIGTATHQFLQFCDYCNVDSNGICEEAARLRKLGFITERTEKIINYKMLDGFFKSRLYALIKDADEVHREFHFGLFRPASDFTENENLKSVLGDKKIFVQGSVDLLIKDKCGDIFICDYKTDRVSAEERADLPLLIKNMKDKHGEQLKQYSHAIKQIFGKEPKRVFIFSLAIGEVIDLE